MPSKRKESEKNNKAVDQPKQKKFKQEKKESEKVIPLNVDFPRKVKKVMDPEENAVVSENVKLISFKTVDAGVELLAYVVSVRYPMIHLQATNCVFCSMRVTERSENFWVGRVLPVKYTGNGECELLWNDNAMIGSRALVRIDSIQEYGYTCKIKDKVGFVAKEESEKRLAVDDLFFGYVKEIDAAIKLTSQPVEFKTNFMDGLKMGTMLKVSSTDDIANGIIVKSKGMLFSSCHQATQSHCFIVGKNEKDYNVSFNQLLSSDTLSFEDFQGDKLKVKVMREFRHAYKCSEYAMMMKKDTAETKTGEEILVRVVRFDPINSVKYVSNAKNILDADVFSRKELKPGMVVGAKVIKVLEGGVIVNLNTKTDYEVRAFIPNHLKSEKIKNVTKVKITFVDVKGIFCTNKSLLVNNFVFTTTPKLNQLSYGIVLKSSKISVVGFCNNIIGTVKLELPVGNVYQFKANQMVKNKLFLELNSQELNLIENAEFRRTANGIRVMHESQVIIENNVINDTDNIYSKDTIDCVVYQNEFGMNQATSKPLVLDYVKKRMASDEIVENFNLSECVFGQTLPGFVTRVKGTFALITLFYVCNKQIYKIKSVCGAGQACGRFVSDLKEVLCAGQSVLARMVTFDQDNVRCVLRPFDSTNYLSLLESHLYNSQFTELPVEHTTTTEGVNFVKGYVYEVSDEFALVRISGWVGTISNYHMNGQTLCVKQSVECRVIDFSTNLKTLDLSLRSVPESSIVELVNDYYLVVSNPYPVYVDYKGFNPETAGSYVAGQSVELENIREFNGFKVGNIAIKRSISVGNIIQCVVRKVGKTSLEVVVQMKTIGFIHFSDIQDITTLPSAGDVLTVRVIRKLKKKIFLSTILTPPVINVGDIVRAIVTEFKDEKYIVYLSGYSKFHLYPDWFPTVPTIGGTVQVQIRAMEQGRVTKISIPFGLNVGDIVSGKIFKIGVQFILLRVKNRVGRVHLTEVHDYYNNQPFAAYKVDDLVDCFVLNSEEEGLKLSLRPSRTGQETETIEKSEMHQPQVENLNVNDVVYGYIISIAAGLFICLSESLHGRVRISNISDEYLPEWKENFNVGDVVKARVIEMEDDKIELTLKQSVVEGEQSLTAGDIKAGTVSRILEYGMLVKMDGGRIGLCYRNQIRENDVERGKVGDLYEVGDRVRVKVLKVTGNKVEIGMKPSYFEQIDVDAMDEGDDVLVAPEAEDMQVDIEPLAVESFSWDAPAETVASFNTTPVAASFEANINTFEKQLLASPNSSFVWIQYMAHHLQLTNIEQAQKIARRALNTISPTMEKERRNVWIALINLTKEYGSDEEFDKIVKEASNACDAIVIGLHVCQILEGEALEAHIKSLLKKFPLNVSIWQFLLEKSVKETPENTNALLRKAMDRPFDKPSVTKLQLLLFTARQEYLNGSIERGRSYFEELVTSYPKRLDIWNVYVDMEEKSEKSRACKILERAVAGKWSVKKVKALFKRWIGLEEGEGKEKVKQRAKEWVEQREE